MSEKKASVIDLKQTYSVYVIFLFINYLYVGKNIYHGAGVIS